MVEKRIAIIGGGFAGLATGCYARMNGYEVDIFEQHTLTGGLCTAWNRRGYTFDGCIHWLLGSNPNSAMSTYWRELGVLNGQQFINPEVFFTVDGQNGERFTCYTNPEHLEAEMLRLAPEDAVEIKRFISLIGMMRRPGSPTNMADRSQAGTLRWLFTWVPIFMKYGRLTIQDYAKRFRNPFLRWALLAGWDFPHFAFMAAPMNLALLADKNAGYPIGGSLRLTEALERRATELGCRIHLGTRVEKVLVEGNAAVGIQLAGGVKHHTDYVVGAGDLHSLIFELLDSRFGSKRQKDYFNKLPTFESIMLLSYGVKRDFAELPKATSNNILQFSQKHMLAGAPHDALRYRVFNFDQTLAPPGSTVVQVTLNAPYRFWKELSYDHTRYLQAKQQVADECADLLEAYFPGFKESIEVVDIASPITFERYTSNWHGSYEGWLITPKTMKMRMEKTLAGLDGLYPVGQWVQPGGGLPTAAITSRQIIEMLCKNDGKSFQAEEVPVAEDDSILA